jgi:ubiquinone/menaquinone biosynthesis C-methylase UbiE
VTSTEESRQKYDALAERHEEIFFYVAEVGRQLVSYAEPAPGARVLDVGAGRGAVARAALAAGCRVTAVDSSPGMVARLSADHPEMVVRQRDAGRLGFTAGSFDVVTAGFGVQVLTSPSDALTEFRRVLAPGGVVVLSLERQEIGRLEWLRDVNRRYFGGGGGSPMTADQLDELLLSAGFSSPTRVTVDIPKRLANPAEMWDWLAEQGVAAAVDRLPTNQAIAFREQFFRGAEEMHRNGGIEVNFGATLHRATAS